MKKTIQAFKKEATKYHNLVEKKDNAKEEIRLQNLQVIQSKVFLQKILFENNKEKAFLKEGDNMVYVKDMECLLFIELNNHKQITDVSLVETNFSII